MVRPRRIDRSTIALTTIRVRPSVLKKLNELKLKHGFKDHNSTLMYYLPANAEDNKVIFHTAREIYDLTKHNPDINRMIKDASNQIMQRINKSEPNKAKAKPTNHKPSWHKRQRRQGQHW